VDEQIRPDQLREVLLKLEVTQYARGEMHLIKTDLRELVARDLKDHRQELRQRNHRSIAIVVTTAAVLVGGDVWTLRDSVSRARDSVSKEIEASRERSRTALAAEVKRIQQEVSNRLDREFGEPQMRRLVEQKAREYTEGEARSYITGQVEQGLRPFREQVSLAMGEISKQRDLVASYRTKVNEALDVLDKRLEAADPVLQPIRTATATVEVQVDSDQQINTTFIDRGGYFALGRGDKPLLMASGSEARRYRRVETGLSGAQCGTWMPPIRPWVSPSSH
jgi:hypothetical protein